MAAKKKVKKQETTSTFARSNDGTIQITYTIPYKTIDKARLDAASELAKDIDVPGFRKGKAPLAKVIEKIPQNTLLEKSLGKILPDLFAKSIKKHNLKPAIYPKFDLIKAVDGEDWQIRATTCEIPEVKLGDYKNAISDLGKSGKIWVPGSDKHDNKNDEPTKAEKEQKVINLLLEKINPTVPGILIDQEADSRLAKLLERLEKLGLTLESYLSSIQKTAEDLRNEYRDQARASIALELILNKMAQDEKISVSEKEIDTTIEAAGADPNLKENLNTPEQRNIIRGILSRRKILDSLASLL